MAVRADKPANVAGLRLPQLIRRYNAARIREKRAKAAVEACVPALKAFAERYGKPVSKSERRAQRTIDGQVCIVHLGLAEDFEPEVDKVLQAFGLRACLKAEMLGIRVKPLRELASKHQVPLKQLGLVLPPVVRIGKCEVVKREGR